MSQIEVPKADDATADQSVVVVGIGASAGGLEAMETLLGNLPADSGMAFVLVQHFDPTHTSLMPELLARQTKMTVKAAEDGMPLEPDVLYVIPPNVAMTVKDGLLRTTTPIEHKIVRTLIDVFFCSLAEDKGPAAIGVVLSGAGTDGTRGLKSIKEHGGLTMAQSPTSAKYDSMPASAIHTGLVDFTLPVEQIASKLVEHRKYIADTVHEDSPADGKLLRLVPKICEILHQATGHDFSGYKTGTIVRRIQRRMQVHRLTSPDLYVDKLQNDRQEAESLFKDLLISVTQFFRDPEAFDVLASQGIAKLLEGKGAGDKVRVWVPGCASGEEAYSIAILLHEAIAKLKSKPSACVFATDIDEEAIITARAGRYPASAVDRVSPERLKEFFVLQNELYQVKNQIRDMCVFSVHDLVRDPPFSVLDLVSCRNVFIYMDSDLQKKLIPLFHYSLTASGYLFLGASEGVGTSKQLFSDVDGKQRLFQRTDARAVVVFPLSVPNQPQTRRESVKQQEQPPKRDLGPLVEKLALEYAPPCVIIDEDAQIVYSSGETTIFLRQPTGAATLNIIDQARKGLRVGLRSAIRQAIKSRQPVIHESLAVNTPNGPRAIDLIVRGFPNVGGRNLLAVIFKSASRKYSASATSASDDSAMGQMEAELKITQEELQFKSETLDRATESATSSTEELHSLNEEMQSANEELQSSKEEMQSVNEELSTVNSELIKKVDQVDRANADLQNFIRSSEIATLFLDRELRIKRFTPTATALFRLRDSDEGRPISDFAPRFADPDLIPQMKTAMRTLAVSARQVYLPETQLWYLVRIIPSRATGNIIDGVVVTFVDITELKQGEDSLRQSEERSRQLADTIPALVWTAAPDGTRDFYNERVRGYQGFERRQNGSWEWTSALHPDDAASAIATWKRAMNAGEGYQLEHRLRLSDGRWRWHLGQEAPVRDETGQIIRWSGTAVDIHDLRTAQDANIEAATAKVAADHISSLKDEFLAMLSHELRTPLGPVVLALEVLEADPNLDEETHANIKMIRSNVELEAHLIDDLLDVTRISRGKIELDLRPMDVGVVLRQAIEVCTGDIESRNLRFTLDCPEGTLLVSADAVRLQQAFWNLLRNAIKFTPAGGQVSIRCRSEETQIIIEVIDSGEGIDADLLPRLFAAFEQGGRRVTQQFGGLGLGLRITKDLVTLHGGAITARSEGKGKGATFEMRLPQLPPGTVIALEKTASPKAAAPFVPGRELHILLVEDHADTARIMVRLLTARGCKVQSANNITTALQLVDESKSSPFDFVISDLGLPDGSGIDMMRTIRQSGLKLPGIAISGYGQDQDIHKSEQAGFAAHLVKPVTIPRLEAAIAKLVKDIFPDQNA